MDDLSEKPCRCGEVMGEVIGFEQRPYSEHPVRYRVGWYCPECQAFEKAILRERDIDTK